MQQFPTLLGVITGAILTFALSNIGERHRWRRDQRVRWDVARLQAYVEYGNEVKRVVHVATGMARTRGLRHASEAVPLEQGPRGPDVVGQSWNQICAESRLDQGDMKRAGAQIFGVAFTALSGARAPDAGDEIAAVTVGVIGVSTPAVP